jgi:hypothetical protein
VSGLAVEGRILGVRISCVSYAPGVRIKILGVRISCGSYAPGYNVPLDDSGRGDYAQGACFGSRLLFSPIQD